jgi:hypothetical protein
MTNQSFDFVDFNRIRVDGAVSIDIVRSDTFNIMVTAEDISHIRVEKIGDTLRIGRRGFDWMSLFRTRPHASVTMPELYELTLSGASQGKVRGFQSDRDFFLKLSGASHLEAGAMSTGKVWVEVSGASNFTGDIRAIGDARFDISGASRVELTGPGRDAVIELWGASQARLANLTLNNAAVNISGASSAFLRVNGKLDINLSGASHLEYAGNPSLGEIRVSGASTLRHM